MLRLCLVLGASKLGGALIDVATEPGTVDARSLRGEGFSGLEGMSSQEQTAVIRYVNFIADDIFEGAEYEPPIKPNQPVMSGFERARRFNRCSMEYHAPGWTPLFVKNEELHAIYAVECKSGSSTMRAAIQPFVVNNTLWQSADAASEAATRLGGKAVASQEEVAEDADNTLFTVVRDPVARAISIFFEGRLQCGGCEQLRDLSEGTVAAQAAITVDPELSTEALACFERVVGLWEQPKHPCMGNHGAGQRSRLPDPRRVPVTFVGSLATAARDWRDLGEYQRERFGLRDWPAFPVRHIRANGPFFHNLLNVSMIPAELQQRICTLFRDDYCCFGLPIPPACSLRC